MSTSKAIRAAMQAHIDATASLPPITRAEGGRNCLTYWFPKLEAAGVPVPKTVVVDAGEDWADLLRMIEGRGDERLKGAVVLDPLEAAIRAAAPAVGGYPLFLRTGHGSGKHNWRNCCHVPAAATVRERVMGLVYWSELCGMFGELPYRRWAVREMLPVEPVVTLPNYGDMPLVREVRAFVAGGRMTCLHPYWPAKAVREGFDGQQPAHPAGDDAMDDGQIDLIAAEAASIPVADVTAVLDLVARVAAAFAGDGAWSVDVLSTKRGWFVTDMAEAGRSFHYPGCPNGKAGAA